MNGLYELQDTSEIPAKLRGRHWDEKAWWQRVTRGKPWYLKDDGSGCRIQFDTRRGNSGLWLVYGPDGCTDPYFAKNTEDVPPTYGWKPSQALTRRYRFLSPPTIEKRDTAAFRDVIAEGFPRENYHEIFQTIAVMIAAPEPFVVKGAGTSHVVNGRYEPQDPSEMPAELRSDSNWSEHPQRWLKMTCGKPWYWKDDGCWIHFDSDCWIMRNPNGDYDYFVESTADVPPTDGWMQVRDSGPDIRASLTLVEAAGEK